MDLYRLRAAIGLHYVRVGQSDPPLIFWEQKPAPCRIFLFTLMSHLWALVLCLSWVPETDQIPSDLPQPRTRCSAEKTCEVAWLQPPEITLYGGNICPDVTSAHLVTWPVPLMPLLKIIT